MRKTSSVCGTLLLLGMYAAGAVPATAQSASNLSLGEIVSRMQAAEDQVHMRPGYTVLREYRLSGADGNSASSQVLAEIDYVPPAQKQFAIRQVQGSERGEKIVRRVLEHEVKMARDSSTSSFSSDNYDFALLGVGPLNGKSHYLLQLTPRHETTELLRGKAWVDPETFLIVRVEGTPAKSPSWLIRDLHVSIDYGRADGIWLPLSTQAKADIRLLGPHLMTSRDLQVRAATVDAHLKPASGVSRHRSRSHAAVADAGLWVPR